MEAELKTCQEGAERHPDLWAFTKGQAGVHRSLLHLSDIGFVTENCEHFLIKRESILCAQSTQSHYGQSGSVDRLREIKLWNNLCQLWVNSTRTKLYINQQTKMTIIWCWCYICYGSVSEFFMQTVIIQMPSREDVCNIVYICRSTLSHSLT